MRPLRLLAASAALAYACLAQTHPMTAEETFSLQNVGELVAAPKSPALLYGLSRTDLAANRSQREWRMLGSEAPVQGLPAGASSLRWSPDGRALAYFHEGGLWVLDWQSHQARRLCDIFFSNAYLAHAGNSLSWSPDSKQLAFAATLEPEKPRPDPLVITRVQYKTRTSFSDNRRTHLYVIDAAGGTPKLLTPGDNDEHSIDWTAGAEIVFLSNHEPDPDARLNYDIFAVNAASGAIRQLTKTPGVELEPALSPDGSTIAFTATTRPITTIDSIAEDEHLWVMPAAGGEPKQVNEKLDRRMSPAVWLAGRAEPLYTAQDHGRTLLFRGQERLLERNATFGEPVEWNGRLYFAMGDNLHPREIWSLGDGKLQQETHVNDRRLAQWELSEPRRIEFKSFDGTPIEGWLYEPLNTDKRYPLVLQIHGGPHGMYGYSFNAQAQYAAARGYATLLVNPRGSSGYGQKFSDGCVNNWGGGDYKDLMGALDYVLKNNPKADPARLFVYGGSYGGFMTNWVVTQTSRFRAAASAASVSNLISFYGTSLYSDLVHAEFNGFPWEGNNFATLWSWSPLKFIRNAKTPVLFLHGELDHDVPITQAEEMYTALRIRGVEAVLVRYPREGHGFREPRHQMDALVRRFEWFDQFLK